jgi:glucose uptake protein GlcU
MENFLMGAIGMGSTVVALFFLRFWRDTGDRLFGIFALAFLLLGFTRLGLAMASDSMEGNTSLYWVRLAAFLLILAAIVDKNRR